MSVMYKLYKLVRTFKDGRTDTSNGKWFARAISIGTVETAKNAADVVEEA
ncbi:MAG: hypothetical protein ACI3Y5_02105 [Prevotella sp.]